MHCRFVSIFSYLTHLTDKDQENTNQASHLVSVRLILQSYAKTVPKSQLCLSFFFPHVLRIDFSIAIWNGYRHFKLNDILVSTEVMKVK